MKRSLKVVIGFVLASALAGCQTTFYEAGTTPITLSPTVVAGFEEYKKADYPLFFAVSTNGQGYAYFTCPSRPAYCETDPSGELISLCEEHSGGVDCKIFAFDRGIVWKGPITYPKVHADFLFVFAKTVGEDSTNYGGTGNFSDNGRMIDLSLRNALCRGEANLATKKWFLRCRKNNYSANGTFVAGTGAEKYYGIGRSSTGGSVEIKLFDPNLPAGASTYNTTKPVSSELPKPQPGTSRPRSDIKGILRAKGLSDLEAFQEAKNYIGTNCLDEFERYEERHSSGLETAFAYAQERIGGRYACGGGYSMIVENAKDHALGRCERAREKHGVNAPCEILAIGNKIVWEGKTVRSK